MELTTTFLRCDWLGAELERLRLELQLLTKKPHLSPDEHQVCLRNWQSILHETRYSDLAVGSENKSLLLHFLVKQEEAMQAVLDFQQQKVEELWLARGLHSASEGARKEHFDLLSDENDYQWLWDNTNYFGNRALADGTSRVVAKATFSKS
jgi:hypothetical protein